MFTIENVMPGMYEAMFTRKSVRAYSGEPLSVETFDKISEMIYELTPLFPEEKYHFTLEPVRGDSDVRLCAYCEDKLESYINVGFMLQQMDLRFHAMGLGSLWFGMGKDPGGSEKDGLKYAICMKVGNPAGSIARKGTTEFDRKDIDEVIIGASPDLKKAFEPVRLAPSATNSQPWKFICEGASIHVYCKQQNIVMRKFVGNMNKIDIGIALCHAALSLAHEGKEIKAIESTPGAPEQKGYYYCTSISGVA
jgi:nitroreductase